MPDGIRWLLCDYGEVLTLPQPAADIAALEGAAGRSGGAFWDAYWQHRPDYDRAAVTVEVYWTAVLGEPVERAAIEALVALDVASWLHLNPATVDAVGRARERGLRLALLSNAPHEVADVVDAAEFAAIFEQRIFSCRLGLMKPEPAIYAGALELLGADPAEVIFVDDRPANVDAARALGIRAHLFIDPTEIDEIG
ncbi:MAG: HAD family hydrolase [Solirubrobacteraceae bacterium]